jgi:hypothetical protein
MDFNVVIHVGIQTRKTQLCIKHIGKGGEFQETGWYCINQIQVPQDMVQCRLLENLGIQGMRENPWARVAIKKF